MVVLDSPVLVKEYEQLFEKKKYSSEDILYQAWLLLKLSANGSEKEAFSHVLAKRKPKNLKQKTQTRKAPEPEGAAKYNLNDPAWDEIFLRNPVEADDGNNNRNKKGKAAKKSGAGKKSSSKKSNPIQEPSNTQPSMVEIPIMPSSSGQASPTSDQATASASSSSQSSQPEMETSKKSVRISDHDHAGDIIEENLIQIPTSTVKRMTRVRNVTYNGPKKVPRNIETKRKRKK